MARAACSCRFRAVLNGTLTPDSRHLAWHVCSTRVKPFRCRCASACCTRARARPAAPRVPRAVQAPGAHVPKAWLHLEAYFGSCTHDIRWGGSDRLQCVRAPLVCRCAPAPCGRCSMRIPPQIVLPCSLHSVAPPEPWFHAARWAT